MRIDFTGASSGEFLVGPEPGGQDEQQDQDVLPIHAFHPPPGLLPLNMTPVEINTTAMKT